uniref:hypothetical protein n=1 Tax=uncultured Duncaniella sp. TaxID=2768039 RepID=UPI00263612F3
MIVNAGGGASGSSMTPYEYAVAGGYTGTEEEFRATLSEAPWIPAEGRIYENNTEAFNGFVPGHIGECNHFEGSGHSLWMSSDGHILQNCHISGKDNALSEGSGTPSMPVVGMTILGTSHNIATCSNIYAAWDDDSYVPGGMVSQGTYECGQGIVVLGDSNSSM